MCAECVQVNHIFHVHVTPSPWTHTHVAPLHKHAHPVSQKVPLEGEGKGSRVAKGSWGASDGVESTPQHALEQPNLPLFSTLASALCTLVSPCPPRTPRDRAATHLRHTSSAAASNRPPNTSATVTFRGGRKGGTLLQIVDKTQPLGETDAHEQSPLCLIGFL